MPSPLKRWVGVCKTKTMKYRVGNHTGLVILTTHDSKEVAHCATKEIAQEICYLLNNKISDSVELKCPECNVISDSVKKHNSYGLQCYSCYMEDVFFDENYD